MRYTKNDIQIVSYIVYRIHEDPNRAMDQYTVEHVMQQASLEAKIKNRLQLYARKNDLWMMPEFKAICKTGYISGKVKVMKVF